MDRIPPLLLILFGLVPAAFAAAASPMAQEAGFTPLFNGADLEGWSGDMRYWSMESGEVVGRSTAEQPLERSTYLFWSGEATDFELQFQYKIIGGNSGVQYRSQPLPDGDVAGYQADMEDGPSYSGILYESNGRGILAPRGSHFEILEDDSRRIQPGLGSAEDLQAAIRNREWNDYRILADGPHIIHEINGVRMVDIMDRSAVNARAKGTFALQLHVGPPMEVRYKNMRLKRLAKQQRTQEPEWIWGPEPAGTAEHRYFAFPFELPVAATVSGGLFAADNSFELFLDGTQLADGQDWMTPTALPSGMTLSPGQHLLTLHAANESGPAGVLGYLALRTDAEQEIILPTQSSWMSWSTPPQGWPNLSTPLPPNGARSRSFGPSSANSGPWGNVLRKSEAPDPAEFELPPGFICERLYSAQPGEGSWASMTFAPDGRLFISPERGPLLRFHPGPELLHGKPAQPSNQNEMRGAHVKDFPAPSILDFPIGSAQGMEWAFDSLYVNVAGNADEDGGLHRLEDKDRDGILDSHQHLARYGPPSEHGAHGIRLGPDGWLYLIHGNYSQLPIGPEQQSILAEKHAFQNWAEDTLLPRIWDPRGHAHEIFSPGALLWKTNANASRWERVAGGMRNPYDIAISDDGEIFTYDADMEWDLGTPWYRPPRVLHLTPGAEFGWRSGSAKWPSSYPDSLPAIVDTDLASPTGVELGSGSRFPEEYQQALFLGDWAWGRITVAQLEGDGATYRGQMQPFLQGRGLAVTDMEFGPDGWLWFIIGGRGTQSGLYRVRHQQAGEPQPLLSPPLLAKRRHLETLGSNNAADISAIHQGLSHADRWLQTAARLALERNMKGLQNPTSNAIIGLGKWPQDSTLLAALAWIRVDPDQAASELSDRLLRTFELQALDGQELSKQYLLLRTLMLLQTRSEPARAGLMALRKSLLMQFPLSDATANRMLAELLVAFQADNLPTQFLKQMQAPASQEQQLFFATLLRLVSKGWTPESDAQYFSWLQSARDFQGGASLVGFLDAMKKEARTRLSEKEWQTLLSSLEIPAVQDTTPTSTTDLSPAPASGRSFQRDWQLTEALHAATLNRDHADASRGASLFGQALCIQCHRFDGKGGFLGPDLTSVSRRFISKDILEAIIDPQKITSDQYAVVAMPSGLLQSFTAQEIADLLAFLEEGRWP